MRNGFSFNGIHSGVFGGVTVSTDDRPILPEMKETTFSPPNRDGAISFAAANPENREYYEDRIFQIKIKIAADGLGDLQNTLTLLSRWLHGSGDLIFDDIPNVKWAARIIEAVPYTPEHRGRKAELDVKLRVRPFSKLVFDVIDGPVLDSNIPLDSAIPLDIGGFFDFPDFQGGGMQVRNIGDVPARPVITVNGSYTRRLQMTCRGISIEVPGSCIIDCERRIVTDISGKSSLMTEVSGGFFELAPGINNIIAVPLSGGALYHITVRYAPEYLYNVSLTETRFE